MLMFAACVRFSMSRRPRPTDSALESRLIDCEHDAALLHDAPMLPTVHVPDVQTPDTLVTPKPLDGKYQSVKSVCPAKKLVTMRSMRVTSFSWPHTPPGSVVGGGPLFGTAPGGIGPS